MKVSRELSNDGASYAPKGLVGERLKRGLGGPLKVTIRRGIPEADVVVGFVVGIGRDWLALAKFDGGIRMDGWVMIRIGDIQAVGLEPDPDCFEIRVLKARKEWPPRALDVPLIDTVSLVTEAAKMAPILSVFEEFNDPELCWIGAVVSIEEHSVGILEIGNDAIWYSKPRSFDLGDVTRIELCGAYEDALALGSGERPQRM